MADVVTPYHKGGWPDLTDINDLVHSNILI
jgi:hypothetical protein